MAREEGLEDWKQVVEVAYLDDTSRALLRENGFALPSERIEAGRWPLAAEAARACRLVVAGSAELRAVQALGVPTFLFAYHRGSDGWSYREGSSDEARSGTRMGVAEALAGPDADDDALDVACGGLLDAIARHLSAGRLTERDLITASALPALARVGAVIDEATLDRFERDGGVECSTTPRELDAALTTAIEQAVAIERAERLAVEAASRMATDAPGWVITLILVATAVGIAWVIYRVLFV